jgi:D-alanyl-lipoteichoic acid acyltransferase DltB (MBOAT superfamily)
MLFNSYLFIFAFLPITYFLYFFLLRKRLVHAAKASLVLASLFFYSWWNIAYLPLLLLSISINFFLGKTLCGCYFIHANKKTILTLGILLNLLLLGYFKYADFFIANVNWVFGLNHSQLNLLLPLAISFFTFQQIAYLVDSYKEETKKYDFLNYALFVSFFPQLIAGPIVHHKEMMPQFYLARNLALRYKNIVLGLFTFFIGLFKKVVIADTFAEWATKGFDEATILTFAEGWATSLSFTFQLYFDFSGYTDMAIGIALLFNIKLPINFNSPYKATDIQDFWRRWHMTLTRFLRDHVYIPLGGNKTKPLRIHANLMGTFLIGGLWHGAGWTFVFWGFIHGLAIISHRIWRDLGFRMNRFLAGVITFNFVNIAWVFFRANDWKDATKVLNGMFGFEGVIISKSLFEAIPGLSKFGFSVGDHLANMLANDDVFRMIIVASIIVFFFKNSNHFRNTLKMNWSVLIFASLLFAISILSINKVSPFLYFNF